MRCPSLSDLPVVPGKTGWPWDTESERLPDCRSDGTSWPRMSIITPSFNQATFIEETIRSILLQGYPDLEYIVIDGNSSDNSVEIIRKYEPWISYWVSEKDNSQSDAINKGFNKATGVYGNWINSDDLLCQNALHNLAKQVHFDQDTVFIGVCLIVDKEGKLLRKQQSDITTLEQLIDIAGYWRKAQSIAQQAALYPVSAFKNTGALNVYNHLSMDYELWGNFLLHQYAFRYIDAEIGIFRTYQGQKISDLANTTRSLVASARKILWKSPFAFFAKLSLESKLDLYYIWYLYHSFRSWIGMKRRLQNLINDGNS